MNIIGALIEPVTGLLDKFIPDADTKAKLAHDIATLAETQAHAQVLAQLEVAKMGAAHKSLFVAGARPFILWTCGLAMFNNYIVVPYAVAGGYPVPSLDMGEMMPVLMGILGLGGYRSFEKYKGVARER